MKDKVIITKEKLKKLLQSAIKLQLLEIGGVDNWEWCDESLYGEINYKDAVQNIEDKIDSMKDGSLYEGDLF